MNFGEELCGEWLRHIRGCEFIQYNLQMSHTHGEIDVIGLNLVERTVYVCEVAVHLTTGLQYVKDRRPDNVARLIAKFSKDIEWARGRFPDYRHVFMLWSPIVKGRTENPVYNQVGHVQEVERTILSETGVALELVINDAFLRAIEDLRAFAGKQSKELDSPVMRLLQVEAYLRRHLKRNGAREETTRATG